MLAAAVSNQITAALHHTIVNAAALFPGASIFSSATSDSKIELAVNNNPLAVVEDSDWEIVIGFVLASVRSAMAEFSGDVGMEPTVS